MRVPRGVNLILAVGLAALLIGSLGRPLPARAAEYTLVTAADYTLRPDEGEVLVAVEMTFTNTTPDPEGQFSLFDELRLAIHDGAEDVSASDADGDLEVEVDAEDGVSVATVDLREPLRFEDTVDIELSYRIVEDGDPQVRIGPSLAVFPAWGFGTTSEVRVQVPDGYDVRVDGDPLTEADDGSLTSGPIEAPASWLAVVSALGEPDYQPFEATVPLEGGTVDVLVRAFGDDAAWGEATRDLVVEALPAMERAIGLPYPLVGQLILTQSVPTDGSGFGEPITRRAQIEVAYDQPPFTILHQLAHLWLDAPLVDARWIAEGMASDVAARVADELGVDTPFDPATEAERRADDAFPLDTWRAGGNTAATAWANAAAWTMIGEVRAEVGDDVLRTILARTAASVGPYDETAVELPSLGATTPRTPLTTRSFLDQLAAVGDADVTESFSATVLTDDDVALLPLRATAREALGSLVGDADGWGAPDPVRAAMTAWQFAEAVGLIDDAEAWLVDRNALLSDIERAGLSRPERLRQVFHSYGGAAEAVDELASERAVVDAYASAAERINAPRTFLARLGLVGGADPATQLDLANGRFADGDLRGALDSVQQAERVLDAAETTGIVRVVSLGLLMIGLAAVAIAVFRRRASYTAAR